MIVVIGIGELVYGHTTIRLYALYMRPLKNQITSIGWPILSTRCDTTNVGVGCAALQDACYSMVIALGYVAPVLPANARAVVMNS